MGLAADVELGLEKELLSSGLLDRSLNISSLTNMGLCSFCRNNGSRVTMSYNERGASKIC